MPLVLSRAMPARDAAPYRHAWRLSLQLEAGADFSLDLRTRGTRLTDAGRARLRALSAAGEFKWLTQRHCEDVVTLALTARHLLEAGRDYLVKDGGVRIVDATTGRTANGRSWSQGLHQLVEIKEGIRPGPHVDPLVQITSQRFFPRYLRLCGVSGTLAECRDELARIYRGHVCTVPLRLPDRRRLLRPRVFAHQRAQHDAVAARVADLHAGGQPVLVDVIANDGDVGATRRLVTVLPAGHGRTRVENGRVQYTPDAGFVGSDQFQYLVQAPKSPPRLGTVTVEVAGGGVILALRGRVTDEPVPGATVTVSVGGVDFTAIADENGVYTIDIAALDGDAFVSIHATGTSPSGARVDFFSLVGAIARLDVPLSGPGRAGTSLP